jgi:CheY-like chemotaxis protein/predicted negative regulator of RcsB-dependent stress response
MPPDYANKRFLAVDDFDDMLKTFRRMLEALGISEIHDARNGARALQVMETWPIDVVLCDYNLGDGKDGQQVLEEARARRLLKPHAVFIMVTAETTIEMVLGAVEQKPDDYLTKPFNRNALKTRLERALRRKERYADIDAAAAAGDFARVAALCEAALQAGDSGASELRRRRGEALLAVGEHGAARELFAAVLAERDLSWARMGLGRALHGLGELDAAAELFQALIAENRLNVPAYDWLARTRRAQGDDTAAQGILADAVAISPKSVMRQRRLGEVAMENRDFAVAEKAYRSATRVGRHSHLRSLDDHTSLARCLSGQGQDDEALKVIAAARREASPSGPEARRLALAESESLRALGREDEAREVLAAVDGMEPVSAAHHAELERARALFAQGDRESAVEELKRLVRNHHDDEAVLGAVRDLFAEFGMESEGGRMVSDLREELVRLNNRGVQLARAGDLESAIDLFRDAATGMPDNKVVNLNAAQVALLYMQAKGMQEPLRREVRSYLSRVERTDPENPRFRALYGQYRSLLA